MFWHTDNYHLTLEEPQLKALQGKKLKINVRAGKPLVSGLLGAFQCKLSHVTKLLARKSAWDWCILS